MPQQDQNKLEDRAITTLMRFQVHTVADRWWAFGQMPQASKALEDTTGMRFAKLLGSGGGKGFAPWPDWGTYFLLQTWDRAAEAERFVEKHPYSQEWQSRSASTSVLWLQAYRSMGAWEASNPFEGQDGPNDAAHTVILTRARIRARRLLHFWRSVPKVSDMMAGQPGLCYAKGVGEWPLIDQATVSVWESEAAVNAFAYQGAQHAEVIRKTRQWGWYKEELFARFALVSQSGSPLF
jgi:hypothetical protein